MTGTADESDAPAEIVQDDLLGGEPRLADHRIGVIHVWTTYQNGSTIDEIADEVYPHLRVDQVEAAVDYAREHLRTIAAIERDRERRARERRARARERKQQTLEEPCPDCGSRLVDDEQPLALVYCESCDEARIVKQLVGSEESGTADG